MAGEIVLDGHKLLWHKDRVDAWLRGERIAPITIDWALTRSCIYKCIYCYGKLQTNDIKKITRKVVHSFLSDAKEIGVKAISLISDGESTCSPFFYDSVIYGKSLGLDMAVGTNGILLEYKKLPKLLENLAYLRFNISAADPISYAQIHGCDTECFNRILNIIRECVSIKEKEKLPVTIGLQMVLIPEYSSQVIPLAKIGQDLGVDYLVVKHCSDDELGTLGIDYSQYKGLTDTLKEAESYSTDSYLVRAKWSKILSEGKRSYKKCYGPPFVLQMSGSGLVAPCGMLFNDRYKDKYHIGNIAETRFKGIWESDRYWEVMGRIGSGEFDARTMCGTLCLQHKINEFLDSLVEGKTQLVESKVELPQHINFV